MRANEKYSELLGQTVREAEERIAAMKGNRARLMNHVEAWDKEIEAATADLQALTAVWNRTPFGDQQLANTKPLRSEKSLTGAIEYVLKSLDRKMSATEIRDKMGEWGFDFAGYKSNVVASVHTTLKRLAANGRVTVYNDGPRRRRWEWAKEPDHGSVKGSSESNAQTA